MKNLTTILWLALLVKLFRIANEIAFADLTHVYTEFLILSIVCFVLVGLNSVKLQLSNGKINLIGSVLVLCLSAGLLCLFSNSFPLGYEGNLFTLTYFLRAAIMIGIFGLVSLVELGKRDKRTVYVQLLEVSTGLIVFYAVAIM